MRRNHRTNGGGTTTGTADTGQNGATQKEVEKQQVGSSDMRIVYTIEESLRRSTSRTRTAPKRLQTFSFRSSDGPLQTLQ